MSWRFDQSILRGPTGLWIVTRMRPRRQDFAHPLSDRWQECHEEQALRAEGVP